jgi:hypothetical protein
MFRALDEKAPRVMASQRSRMDPVGKKEERYLGRRGAMTSQTQWKKGGWTQKYAQDTHTHTHIYMAVRRLTNSFSKVYGPVRLSASFLLSSIASVTSSRHAFLSTSLPSSQRGPCVDVGWPWLLGPSHLMPETFQFPNLYSVQNCFFCLHCLPYFLITNRFSNFDVLALRRNLFPWLLLSTHISLLYLYETNSQRQKILKR